MRGNMMGSFDLNLLVANAFHWHMVEVHLAIYHKQWVRVCQNLFIDTHPIQELLEDGPQLRILLAEALALPLNGQVVQLDLVEPLEEVVKVGPLIDAYVCELLPDLLLQVVIAEVEIALLKLVEEVTGEVEGQDLLTLSLELATELGCLDDLLCQAKLIFQGFDAVPCILREVNQPFLFLCPELVHLRLQFLEVLSYMVLLSLELLIPLLTLLTILLDLQLPVLDGRRHALHLPQPPLYLLAEVGVAREELDVLGCAALGGVLVELELLLALCSSLLNLLFEARPHLVVILDVPVADELEG
mmetsp:Transcript_117653/g.344546  ORF Transcript_117653/g.344546 Transcript_117653/m.344546 type:complete len:301 (+) Transcript_117653:440-1342(+)